MYIKNTHISIKNRTRASALYRHLLLVAPNNKTCWWRTYDFGLCTYKLTTDQHMYMHIFKG